jgi:phosphatidyl-myo-inositol alpha-mannosyltransferase
MTIARSRIGMVCPYGWDTPGGVQIHIKELAEYFIARGHDVSVIAPVSDESAVVEPWLVPAGRPLSVPFNGSVARVAFGPVATSRVRQWIASNNFDLLHLHQPEVPSLSLLACWAAEGPMVGTFHTASPKQRTLAAAGPILEPIIEKLTARIAVSEMARSTLREHFQTDAVVIPNGIDLSKYSGAQRREAWSSDQSIGFLGRFEEPRKGLEVLLAALPLISKSLPKFQLFVAGPGNPEPILKSLPSQFRSHITFLGRLTENEKADFLRSVSVYVAPNTGGESFGIILTEAMAAGAAIVASDIPAFSEVLAHGEYGSLFVAGDSTSLAKNIIQVVQEKSSREEVVSRGLHASQRYGWESVATEIADVYELALASGKGVSLASENRPWKRFRSNE